MCNLSVLLYFFFSWGVYTKNAHFAQKGKYMTSNEWDIKHYLEKLNGFGRPVMIYGGENDVMSRAVNEVQYGIVDTEGHVLNVRIPGDTGATIGYTLFFYALIMKAGAPQEFMIPCFTTKDYVRLLTMLQNWLDQTADIPEECSSFVDRYVFISKKPYSSD